MVTTILDVHQLLFHFLFLCIRERDNFQTPMNVTAFGNGSETGVTVGIEVVAICVNFAHALSVSVPFLEAACLDVTLERWKPLET